MIANEERQLGTKFLRIGKRMEPAQIGEVLEQFGEYQLINARYREEFVCLPKISCLFLEDILLNIESNPISSVSKQEKSNRELNLPAKSFIKKHVEQAQV